MQLGQAWARPAGPELQKGLFEVTPWGCPESVPHKQQRSRRAGRSPAGSHGSMEGPRGTHSTPSAGLGRTEGGAGAQGWPRQRLGQRGVGPGSQAEARLCPQVPVAHCFGPRGLYKRRFCSVCRKGLEALGLRCEGTASIPRGPAPGAWSLRPGGPAPLAVRPQVWGGRRGGGCGASQGRALRAEVGWAERRREAGSHPAGVGGVPVSHHGPQTFRKVRSREGQTRARSGGWQGRWAATRGPLTLPAPQCVSCTFTPTVCPSPAATAASATRTGTANT